MAAPVLPLNLERVPFTRDCAFYALSIVLLYWALLDKAIQWYECAILLGAAVVYVLAVYSTTDFVNAIPALRPTESVVEEDASPSRSSVTGKMHGVTVEVEEIVHSRMADGHKPAAAKWVMEPTEQGIYAETMGGGQQQEGPKGKKRASIGFQFDGQHAMLGPILNYNDLKEVVVMSEGVIELEFSHALQHVTLRVKATDMENRDELLKNITECSLGRPWVHGYDPTVKGAVKHLTHSWCSKEVGLFDKICAIPEFLVDVLLKSTLFFCDVKDIRREGRWPICFAGAMFWLAIFSWVMLEVAEQINYNIPALPNSFLGITVCAIGTSFPNAVASILMAQQNKPAAAIANALGSNVQNVFLAMALPWCIYSAQTNGKAIDQNVAGISEGVAWMMGTLIMVVLFALAPPMCALIKPYGFIMLVFYMVYLVLTSGETFGWWPPLMK
eukprot:CAMPEP_0204602132 /NCGR_PEP_ID=MMETSP0661-20131031/56468_1 /ASSEMBLY_ACC=CAM_ASM_000606 /TAXON_ID=109239 /ORGANISM="Alexandrium margalefi, Strain AMGDE01CS-322" /LENGTH=442 /DNA_ID=CAMNT_0051613067 /DNA_START=55 /DNA_END=1383 /DNA_ORIENTATION=+